MPIDRFYRDLGGLLAALHHLHQHHVTFVSITENLDFTMPWGKLILAVLGALAEIYIDKLRDETKKGKRPAPAKGSGTEVFRWDIAMVSALSAPM